MASEKYFTKSGLTPDEKELPFCVKTSDVEAYLQKKVDVILAKIAQENGTKKEQIDVKVYTTEAGKEFIPFVVVLPTNVLKGKPQKKDNTAPIFNVKSTDNTGAMRDELYKLFSSFTYNKNDEDAFFSDDWRRARHVSRDTSAVLKEMRTPKIRSMENGRLRVVTFMLDPLRLFHSMLEMDGDPRDFRIDITGWQKMRTGEYSYFMRRTINKNGKGQKYKNTLADELNRKMRGARGRM